MGQDCFRSTSELDTYLECHADPVDALFKGPLLRLANGVDDGLIIDRYFEAFSVNGLGHALKQSLLVEAHKPFSPVTYDNVPSTSFDSPIAVV